MYMYIAMGYTCIYLVSSVTSSIPFTVSYLPIGFILCLSSASMLLIHIHVMLCVATCWRLFFPSSLCVCSPCSSTNSTCSSFASVTPINQLPPGS